MTAARTLDYAALRDRLSKGKKSLHARLAADLRERAKQPSVETQVARAWDAEREAARTAEDQTEFTERLCGQVATAWILSTLFVRVLEGRGLLRTPRLFGPVAAEAQRAMIELAPRTGPRDYLLLVFDELRQFPVTQPLFDKAHNLAWRLTPSQPLAQALIDFWAEAEDGAPVFPFGREATADTAFLGDLYQDIDAEVKEQYALLQTPPFVAKFILDRTLTPALETFGLGDPEDPTRLIDPTCGSGHFLLLAFERLLAAWKGKAPGAGKKAHVERALRAVQGVDLNPYAIAIARFRLTLAALDSLEVKTIDQAPALPLNLVVADSLLYGEGGQLPLRAQDGHAFDAAFDIEEPEVAERVLGRRYHVVVGNPPYITPKDDARKELYRAGYASAKGKFALSAPFAERFFDLAIEGDQPGVIGLIIANSFMKRDFGEPLVEEVFKARDLSHVIDTQGAFIPGHGTPTIILVGRNTAPRSGNVRAVLGIRGEPREPAAPERGEVWRRIAEHADHDFEDDFITATSLDRKRLDRHPWCLAGGGALELKDRIESASNALSGRVTSVGITAFTLEDEVYLRPSRAWRTRQVPVGRHARPIVEGDRIRDWYIEECAEALFPYDQEFQPCLPTNLVRELWPWKQRLAAGVLFGKKTKIQAGLQWFEWGRLTVPKLRVPSSITLAFVSTHNQFALDLGGKVFKQSAPVVKLAPDATDDDHLDLLSLLNSSTLQFWFRMECHSKGGQGINEGIKSEAWEQFLEYAGKNVEAAPVIDAEREARVALARALIACSAEAQPLTPSYVIASAADSTPFEQLEHRSNEANSADDRRRRRMIALQEELDWLVYRAFGLTADADLPVLSPDDLPEDGLALGHRPFEIVLARRAKAKRFDTSWFDRHGSTPATEVPEGYPAAYRKLLERRVALIEARPRDVGLIEQPEKKRRWSPPDRAAETREAARSWLLDQLEDAMKSEAPRLWSYDHVAVLLDASPKRRAVLQLALGPTEPSAASARRLLEQDTVPGVAALRYQPSGLDKHRRWRAVWERQAGEDRGETVERGPKPPDFKPADFRGSAWSCRGKLDVPKERFVVFPQASDEDTPRDLLAWAGWDELALARLLAPLINRHLQRMDAADSAHAERVVPLFCAIEERIFWVRLWHPEPDPEFNVVWADYLDEFIRGKLPKLSLPQYRTRDDLATWAPQAGKGTRKAAKRKATPADHEEVDAEAKVLVAARPRRARSSPPAPSLDVIVTRLRELGGEATAQNLAEALGIKPAALKKVTTPAVGTTLKLVKKKPVTYALLPEGGEHA